MDEWLNVEIITEGGIKKQVGTDEDIRIKMMEKINGCRDCGEIHLDYIKVENGRKVCPKCGGTVLTLQEAFDYILDLKSRMAQFERGDYYDV